MPIQISIAKDDDDWVFPEDTTLRRDKVYECLDRDCKVPLIPARGDKNAWHFRHKKANPDCTITGETLEHYRDKAALYRNLNRAISDQEFKLSIKLMCHGCYPKHRTQELRWRKGKLILFEVCVTNPVDEDKKRKLNNAKIPWVEIKAEELSENTTTISPFNSSRLT